MRRRKGRKSRPRSRCLSRRLHTILRAKIDERYRHGGPGIWPGPLCDRRQNEAQSSSVDFEHRLLFENEPTTHPQPRRWNPTLRCSTRKVSCDSVSVLVSASNPLGSQSHRAPLRSASGAGDAGSHRRRTNVRKGKDDAAATCSCPEPVPPLRVLQPNKLIVALGLGRGLPTSHPNQRSGRTNHTRCGSMGSAPRYGDHAELCLRVDGALANLPWRRRNTALATMIT